MKNRLPEQRFSVDCDHQTIMKKTLLGLLNDIMDWKKEDKMIRFYCTALGKTITNENYKDYFERYFGCRDEEVLFKQLLQEENTA